MNRFHFLRDFKTAVYMSAVITIITGTGLLIIPKYFVYGSPDIINTESPRTFEIVEDIKIPVPEKDDLNLWIKENLESSIDFYTENLTNDTSISIAIINNSLKHDLSVNLAFSVAYKESRFIKDAFNDNGKSKDRGLFQLNDRYRQDWPEEDFYNIDKNAFEGTRYLKEMIELNENDIVTALYCYNAGPTKVRRDGIIPSRTITYADEILEYEKNLNEKLQNWIVN